MSRLAMGSAAACIGFGLCGAADSLQDYHDGALVMSGLFAATGVFAAGFRVFARGVGLRRRRIAPCKRKAGFLWDPGSEAEFEDFLVESGLTERERRYVMVCLAGESMKEIAAEYGVSASTARNSCASIYRKLSLRGKAELMAFGAAFRRDEKGGYRGAEEGPAPSEGRRGTGKSDDQDPEITTPS